MTTEATESLIVTTARVRDILLDVRRYRCQMLEHIRLCVLSLRHRCLVLEIHKPVPDSIMATDFDSENTFASQADVVQILKVCKGFAIHTS